MAHWHGLAKLRLHNDATLDVLDSVTKSLGDKLREFRDKTCSAFETRELKREYNARIRRTAKSTTAKHTPKGLPFEAHNPITTTTSSVSQAVTPPNSIVLPSRSTDPGKPQNTTAQLFGAIVTEGNEPQLPPPRAKATVPHEQPGVRGRRLKTLNLNTYKFHSLGDYSASIRKYGTSDSYTTELVSSI